MTLTMPPPRVEVAFSTAPLANTPVWTDITEFTRNVSIRRGRDFELARYPSGTATILLDNRDRRFDPGYQGTLVNLLTNPSFEVDTTSYGSFAVSAFTRDTTQSLYGTASAKLTTTNATAAGIGRLGQAIDAIPLAVTAGTTYTASAYVKRGAAGSASMLLRIQWYTSASALISQSDLNFTLDSTSWTRQSVSAVAPATATNVRIWMYTAIAQGVFDFYTDGWQFEASSSATTYSDGTQDNCRWSGTAHASTTYRGGPYYPYVIPGRRIRVRAGSNLAGNGGLESNTSGYGSLSATNTHVITTAKFGVGSMQTDITNVVASGAYLDGWPTAPTPITVVAGRAYTFSLYARLAAASSKAMRLVVEWYSGGAGTLLSTSQTTATLNSTDWQRFSFTATAPQSATSVHLGYWTDSAQGAFTIYTDAWQFEQGSTASVYHDGIGSLYDGFVESWPQDWDPPNESRTALEAADGFKMLQLRKLPGGYPQIVLQDAPAGYWRLGETSGTVAEDSGPNNLDGTYNPAHPGNAPGALVGDSDMAADWSSANEWVQVADNTLLRFTTAITIEAWVYPSDVSGAAIVCKGNAVGDPDYCFEVGATVPADLAFWNGTSWAMVATGVMTTLTWQHVAVTYDGANYRMYRNGVQVGSTTPSAVTIQTSADPFRIGQQGSTAGANAFAGWIDEVAVYPTALSAARIAAHYAAGRGGFPQQTSPQRVTAVLDAVRWPSSQRITYGGTEPVQASTLTSATALQHLQDVADAEAGRIFIDNQGRVRLDGRDVFFTPPFTDTKGTFGDNPLAADELRYTDLVAAYDDTQVWNDVRLTRAGGTEQGVQDATSIDAYGQRTLQTSNMLNTTDVNMLSLAQYRLSQYKQPLLRFVQMALRPGTHVEEWEQVLERDIGDRVRVGRTPQGIAPPIAFDCWIEGIEHDIRPGFWEARWKLSRADAQTYWILDDAAKSLLGTSTFLSF